MYWYNLLFKIESIFFIFDIFLILASMNNYAFNRAVIQS